MALSFGFCLGPEETTYTSESFSDAFNAVFGSGVCPYGTQFAIADINGFSVNIGSGYALTKGRWIKNDEPVTLTLKPASNYKDRYDAVAVRVDYDSRKVTLEVLHDVDSDNPTRNEKEYCIYLYLIYVTRGQTVLEQSNFTDTRGDNNLCGYITPLSEIANNVEYIYNFLKSGIDEEVARIIGLSNKIIENANEAISEIEDKIGETGGVAIGDTVLSLSAPTPQNEYFPCDGSSIPESYQKLIDAIGDKVPLLSTYDERYQYWIYAGSPT